MATFLEQLKTDRDAVLLNTAEFGQSVSYTPTGGEAKSITAVITRQPRERAYDEEGYRIGQTATLFISMDASDGIATITPDLDIVAFDSLTWVVVAFTEHSEMAAATLTVEERTEIGIGSGDRRMRR